MQVRNSGTVDANHVELQFDNAVTDNNAPAAMAMDKVIEITALGWDSNGDGVIDTNLLGLVTDYNLNGIIDLNDLQIRNADGAVDFDNVAFNGTQGNDHLLRIAGNYSPTLMDNTHIGDTVNTTLTFTMNQDASQ